MTKLEALFPENTILKTTLSLEDESNPIGRREPLPQSAAIAAPE